jgi:KDO2-lipid IV(A) lauroyltransferase
MANRIVYLIAYPLLWVVSLLPHRLFYILSDGCYFLVYHILGYRKKVVMENLRLTLPDKSTSELKRIQKDFYRHMCDMFLEMIKTMNLSKAAVKRKYAVENIELLQELEKGKTVLVVCAHYANWEWNVSINNYVNAKGYAVYQRIGNPYFDNLIRKIRGRWNTTLITMEETVRTVVKNERNGIRGIFGMVSDQSPMHFHAPYWSEFLGITVPVFNGAELLARKMDLAVLFLKVSKVKRGHYAARFIPITTGGKETAPNEITETFLRMAEDQIRERPEHYLWTHKRWKHRDKVPETYQKKVSKK